jgi:site-specific DNA-methyltransferase (adenine-specific)
VNNILNKIYNCDNREILKKIPDKSIQVFLEDMPYGITSCKWDKRPDLQEYWDLRLNKIKDNGCFVLFGSEPFSSYLRMSNIKMFKYDWIWEKNIPTGKMIAKIQPMRIYETISIFYNKQALYNRQMIKRTNEEFKKAYRKNNTTHKAKGEHSISLDKGIRQDFDRYFIKPPINIIKFNIDRKRNEKNHPTQKPLTLIEYLIRTYSNEGDLIFDGFSGSGTTAVACNNLNRQFICCEIDKEYYNRSIERLNK